MKKQCALPVILCAVCCILLTGCKSDKKELFYDATQEPDKIAASCCEKESTVECCVIFRAGFLSQYVGWDIVAVKLFNPSDETSSYTPVIYEAEARAKSPGELIVRNFSPAEIEGGTWQTITLDTPVAIEDSKDYWAGYKAETLPHLCLIARNPRANFGNSRIAFQGADTFQRSRSNFLVRIVVKR